ncbi:hypothetical protein M0R45_025535 [Rubus argutus]|uniref:Large ribosomal subunit protein bL12 C-terminal domain-containing protein n=1 Tax=Rubus argutus TaxID=59490 RepID=A0AAW1WWJ7_RUBAR
MLFTTHLEPCLYSQTTITILGSKEHLQSKAGITIHSPARNVAQQISGSLSRTLCTATAASETRTKNLERIADELLDLTKIEKHDYSILFRLKMGLNRYGPAISGMSSTSSESGPASTDSKDAKDLVEKAPVVLKKGVTKEEAGLIVDKLKELGATVVLE